MRQKLKIAGVTIAAFISMLLLLIALISLGFFNADISKIITKNANKQLNATLSIGHLEGNLFSHFALKEISIKRNDSLIIAIETVSIEYNLWELLNKRLQVTKLAITNANFNISEEADSLWNVQKLTTASPEEETESTPSGWEIELQSIQLGELVAHISPRDTNSQIPRNVTLNSNLSFSSNDTSTIAEVAHLSLKAEKPTFTIENLTFSGYFTDSILGWKNLKIVLPKSKISSNGAIPINNIWESAITFKAAPFNFEDTKPWLSAVHGKADIELDLKFINNTSQLKLSVDSKDQHLRATGSINKSEHTTPFKLHLIAENIDGEYWSQNPQLQSAISGYVTINGNGIEMRKNNLTIAAKLANKSENQLKIDSIIGDITKQEDKIDGTINLVTTFGSIASKLHAEQIFTQPKFEGSATIKHLNLATPTENKALKSDINLTVEAKGSIKKNSDLEVTLSAMAEQSKLFNQPINEFITNLTIDGNQYAINNFSYKAPYLKAAITGNGDINDYNQIDFNISTTNIDKIAAAFQLDPVILNGNFKGYLSENKNEINVKSDIRIDRFSMADIALDTVEGDIDTQFKINPDSLNNIDISSLTLMANFDINRGNYQTYNFSKTHILLEKKEKRLTADVKTNSTFGKIDAQISLTDIFKEPTYNLHSTIQNFNLINIVNNAPSNINLTINAKGRGFSPKTMRSNIEIISDSSTIFKLPISDFDARISYNKGRYLLKGCRVETPFILVSATGDGDINRRNNLKFIIKSKDISTISPILTGKNFELTGRAEGELIGSSDSLSLSSHIDISHLSFDTIDIKQITGDTHLLFTDSTTNGTSNLKFDSIRIQQFDLKELTIVSHFTNRKSINTLSFFASDSLNGRIVAKSENTDTLTISFPEVNLNLQNSLWEGNDKSAIKLANNSLDFNNLKLYSKDRSIEINGTFTPDKNEDLHIEIKNLDLISIPGLRLLPYKTAGRVNAKFDLSGTATKPIIEGNATIENLEIADQKFKTYVINTSYANEMLSLKSTLDDTTSRLLTANIEAPLHLSFTDQIYLPKKETPLHAELAIANLNMERLNSFIPLDGLAVKGLLNVTILIDSTIISPQVKGKMNLKNGAISYNKLGVNYTNITLNSHVNNNLLTLDTLLLFSGKGKLLAKGTTTLTSNTDLRAKEIDFSVIGQQFKAFDSELLKATINTEMHLKGSPEAPIFSGDLSVLSSTINTDIFLEEFNRVSDINQPLLVKARKEAELAMFNIPQQTTIETTTTPDSYKRLKGQFNIEIPRNMWVKGKNMTFELMGNLKAIKKGEEIDFFGNMTVKRGFYKLYGRRLEFEEGEIIFTGGDASIPMVNFKIAYKFRDPSKELRKLNVNVTGRATTPKVEFFLDNEAIDEKDAISYLIFNKSARQLDSNENSTMGNSNLDVAKDLAMGQVSNVVKDALQSTLGLDMIEISGKNGWTQGSVSVGKYITNNLFLNYEKVFSLDKKDNVIEPEKITMEYQFFHSLFLQATNQSANSGFDFILKLTWP